MPYLKNALKIVWAGFNNSREELDPFVFDTPMFVFEHLSQT